MTTDWSKGIRGKFAGKKPQISFAGTEKVRAHPDKTERLLRLLGKHLYGPDDTKDWESIWVSDESTLGDFDLEPEQLQAIGQELGFPVKDEDYIPEIIAKMS